MVKALWKRIFDEHEDPEGKLRHKKKPTPRLKLYTRRCGGCNELYKTKFKSKKSNKRCPDCKSEHAKLRVRKDV